MSPILKGVVASQITGRLSTNSFQSIATALVSSSTSQVIMSSIPSTYTHLQVRITSLQSDASNVIIQMNGDTGNNYYWHELYGDGTTPQSGWSGGAVNHIKTGYTHGGGVGTYYTGASIVTIPNYTDTTKKKVVSAFTGSNLDAAASGYVLNRSGHWTNTAAITSLRFFTSSGSGTFAPNMRIALYGIKG